MVHKSGFEAARLGDGDIWNVFIVDVEKSHLYYFLLIIKTKSFSSFRAFVQDSEDEDSEADAVSQLLTRRVKTQEEKVRISRSRTRATT